MHDWRVQLDEVVAVQGRDPLSCLLISMDRFNPMFFLLGNHVCSLGGMLNLLSILPQDSGTMLKAASNSPMFALLKIC